MADKTTGGPAKGKSHGGDQTALPGQAQGGLPFGLDNNLSTGAPGTAGNTSNTEPTLTAPVPSKVFGAPADDASTGAPGSSGATADVAKGASYTIDGGLGNRPHMDETGGSVDTESQGNKYGSSTLPGVAGPGQPKATGAGDGHLMIGGRRVRQQ